MKNLRFLVFTVAVLALVSCGDQGVTNDDPGLTPFLRIGVVDTEGQPVADLRISTWNHLSIGLPGPVQPKSAPKRESAQVSTTFPFAVPVTSQVTILVYDIEGNIVDTLIDRSMEAGHHAVSWDATNDPSGLYECRMSVNSFQRSVFALKHWAGDWDVIEEMGYTTSDGVFETNDSIRFPNTFELPVLFGMDEFGDSVGEFSILDSVAIRLTDTTTGLSQYFERKITNGSNNFTLVWDTLQVVSVPPPAAGSSESHYTRYHILRTSFDSTVVLVDSIILPTEYKLNQNYPNPFN